MTYRSEANPVQSLITIDTRFSIECQYVNMSVRQYVLKLTLLNCQGPYADHDSDGN